MNPKAETVEELQARRKNLHMGMLKLAREDLTLALQTALDAFAVPSCPLLSSLRIEVQIASIASGRLDGQESCPSRS